MCRLHSSQTRLLGVVAGALTFALLSAADVARAQTPTATPTPITVINHFTCYDARPSQFLTVNVDIESPFGPTSIDVKKPKRLCNPANISGQDPGAPGEAEYLVGYRGKQTEPRRLEKERGLTVTNQFGTALVDARKPNLFMVPSAMDEIAVPPPLSDPPPIDHYECFRVGSVAGQSYPTVEVEDVFGTLLFDVKRLRSLCFATNYRGHLLESEAHLACYKVKTAKRTPRFPGREIVYLNNPFGAPQGLDSVALKRSTEICLPSTITRCDTPPFIGSCP